MVYGIAMIGLALFFIIVGGVDRITNRLDDILDEVKRINKEE